MKKLNKYKSLFITYFDGCYNIEPEPNVPNTFSMGICKLDYNDKSNTLTVYLRRPGLLIGRGGELINKVGCYLNCKIDIIEVNLLKF